MLWVDKCFSEAVLSSTAFLPLVYRPFALH